MTNYFCRTGYDTECRKTCFIEQKMFRKCLCIFDLTDLRIRICYFIFIYLSHILKSLIFMRFIFIKNFLHPFTSAKYSKKQKVRNFTHRDFNKVKNLYDQRKSQLSRPISLCAYHSS